MSSTTSDYLRTFDDPKLEAIVETMFLAAYADGEFSDVERAHFARSVESLTDGVVESEKFQTLVDRIIAALGEGTRQDRLEQIKRRLPDAGARKVALSLAIQVMASDGIIRTSEHELIMEMADALDIDRDQAADLVARLAR